MKLPKILNKLQKKYKPASFRLKLFLAFSFFILLGLSHFTALTIYSDILDLFDGNQRFTFFILDFVLLFLAFIWLASMITLSLRHFKRKIDWLYVYGPVFILSLVILFFLY